MLDDGGDEGGEPAVFVPRQKPSSIRKSALHRSAAQLSGSDVARNHDDRPTYSKDYLAKLKQATPSAPSPSTGAEGDQDSSDASGSTDAKPEIDVAAKFGPRPTSKALDVASKFPTSSISLYESSAASRIPSQSEIQAKKAQRARLAREQEARGSGSDSEEDEREPHEHDAMDSDDEFATQRDTISFRAQGTGRSGKKQPESRLVREDERDDFMEDENAYPTSGQISFAPQSEKAQRAAERERIRSAIEGPIAGDVSDDASSTSSSSRDARDAYDRSQTRRGLGREAKNDADDFDITSGNYVPYLPPLPILANSKERIRLKLQKLRSDYAADIARLEEIHRERLRLSKEEDGVNEVLEETKRKWDGLVKSGILRVTWDGEDVVEDRLSDGYVDVMKEEEKRKGVGIGEDAEGRVENEDVKMEED
jgi:Nineteen complex-related protein 2